MWRSADIVPRILKLGTKREKSASSPGRFTAGKELRCDYIGCWVGPTAGLHAQ